MAFPVVQTADTKNGTQASNSSSWTLTYPTNIAAGDLILAFIGRDGGGGGASWPAGWVSQIFLGSGANTLESAKKSATGSETGNFTVTLSGSEQGGWRVFRITGWGGTLGTLGGNAAGSGDVVNSAGASGSSLNPDPDSLDPNNWATEDTLWMACVSLDTSRTISVYPLPDLQTADVSGGSTGATLGICMTNSAVSSLDPGTFTISASDDWAASTLAVRPASTTRVPRSPAVDSGNAHFAKAWQAIRKWRYGANGILVPDLQFAH